MTSNYKIMRHTIVFLVIGILSGLTSYLLSLTPNPSGLIIYLTYPNLFIPSALFAVTLYKLHKEGWRIENILPKSIFEWLGIAIVTLLLLTYEPFEFKIVYDELLMAVAAELIHFSRIVGVAVSANDYEGSYQFHQLFLDKRPFLFPFIVSLIHDLTGYRYTNAFILNAILTPVFLIFINYLGRIFGGNRGGILAVLLAGSLPLLAIMATSGNLEILNMVLLCLILMISLKYLEKPTPTLLVTLIYGLILFFQIRYENGLFMLPFGILILIGWRKAEINLISWQVIVSPIFLILPTLHYLIITRSSGRYFQSGPEGREATFSLNYFSENLESAGNFLFSIGQEQSNSILLTIMGISSCLLFIFYYLKGPMDDRKPTTQSTVLLFFFFGVILHLVLVLLFNYGLFNSYLTARLSLPLSLLMMLAVPFVFNRMGKSATIVTLAFSIISIYFIFLNLPADFLTSKGLQFAAAVSAFTGVGIWGVVRMKSQIAGSILITVLYILTVGIPVGRAHRYSVTTTQNDTVMEELSFIETRDKERLLWIASAPYAAMLTQVNCLPISTMRQDPAALRNLLERNIYDAVYICRRLKHYQGDSYKLLDSGDAFDSGNFETVEVYRSKSGNKTQLLVEKLIDVKLIENNE